MTVDPDVLYTKQAAAFLGVCQRTLQRMVKDREVPSIMVRGRRTFSRAGLTRWKTEQEAASVARQKKVRNAALALVTG